MTNRIGVATAIFDKFGIEDAFKCISEIGYKYIELCYAKGFVENLIKKPEEMSKEDIGEILELCKEYNVQVCAVSVYFYLMNENAVNRLKKVIDTAELLNANTVITDTGEIGIDDDAKKEIFYREIKEIADYAQSKNITICFEIHGGWYSNGKQGSQIIKRINHPNIRLNYDTANVIFFNGGKPEEDILSAIPYMSFMHLKDKLGGPGEWNFPALGDGYIDFNKIFSMLGDYKGPMNVEVELTDEGEHTLEEIKSALKKSYEFLKNYGYVE